MGKLLITYEEVSPQWRFSIISFNIIELNYNISSADVSAIIWWEELLLLQFFYNGQVLF